MPETVLAPLCRGGGGGQCNWETLEQASSLQGRAKSQKVTIKVLPKVRGGQPGSVKETVLNKSVCWRKKQCILYDSAVS